MTTASRVSDSRVTDEISITDCARELILIVKAQTGGYTTGPGYQAFTAACMLEAALACQGPVIKDAERYLKLRNAPLGVDGVPCVALPKGERSGDYINDDYLDAAVDGMPMGESIEEKIQGVIESHEIDKGVKTDNGEDWENGYAFAVESMLGDLTALIAKAQKVTK